MNTLKRVLKTAYSISISLKKLLVLMLWREHYSRHYLIGTPLARGSSKTLWQSCRVIGSFNFWNKPANL
jgi:hypothetical protein